MSSNMEEQGYRDDSFVEQLPSEMARNFRRFDDTNLTRYAWIAGDDIPLNDRSGGRFWGMYKGEVMPKRRLIPIRHAQTLAINEYPALIGSAEVVNAPGYLAPIEAEGFDRANSMRLRRAPRMIAFEMMGEFEASAYGPALFEHAQLMGDDKRDLILKLYRVIVPRELFANPEDVAKQDIGSGPWGVAGAGVLRPVTRRGVLILGDVTNTFLDQWRAYLMTGDPETNIKRARLGRSRPRGEVEGTDTPLSDNDLALYMLERMREAVANAWRDQTEYVSSSRDQILSKRNGGKGKVWYDVRDERYLLETGTVPVNLEEIAAANRSADRSEATFLAGIDKIVERISPQVGQNDVAVQVQRAVADQLGQLLDGLSEAQLMALLERKRAAPAQSPAETTPPEDEETTAAPPREPVLSPEQYLEFERELHEAIDPLDKDDQE